MVLKVSDTLMDELIRSRLRIEQGAHLRIKALRKLMETIDVVSRGTTGQPFFAIRESEDILVQLGSRTGPELVECLMAMKGGTRITPNGLDNIPDDGPVVIGSTHPVGTFDFITHAGALLDKRPDLKVVANREAERFLGQERIVAVDLDNKDKVHSARATLAGMSEHLKNDGALLVFGSGRVANMRNGCLFEPAWRSGITRMSAACNAPIIPASADMRNSRHYYRTRRAFEILSFGNEYTGRAVASLRYSSELQAKLGGHYEVFYGAPQRPGTEPERLKSLAEALVPGLYTHP